MNSRFLRTLAAAAAAAWIGGTGTSTAQDTQPAPEFSSWRVPGWSFTPGISLAGVFDSNVALASAPADTRRTQSDRLVLFEPFGSLEYLSTRTEFATGYRGYVRRYLDVRELDSFDQHGYVSLRRLASRRLTFFLRDSYSAVPTTDEVELNGVPFTRAGIRTNTFSGGFEARASKFTDVGMRYDLTWVDFDRELDTPPPGTAAPLRPAALLTGGWVHALRADTGRRLTERLNVGLEYAFRFADLNEGTRELTFHDAGATARFLLTARTALSAAAGVSRLRDEALDDTRMGPYYRAALTHTAARGSLGVSFERTFVPSFGFGGSSDSQELRAFVRMPVSRNRMYVQGSAAWRRTDPLIATELDLDTIWVRTTFGYAVVRWLRVEAFHAYTRQDSRITGGEIDRQRAGVQLVIAQPMRIR